MNNCDVTLFFSELRLDDVSSEPDETPELDIWGANLHTNSRYITIRNNGWGNVNNAILSGRLVHDHSGSARQIKVDLGNIDYEAKIDAGRLIQDVLGIRKLAYGDAVRFNGELAFTYNNLDDKHMGKEKYVSFYIRNIQPSPSSNVGASAHYNADGNVDSLLKTDEKSYRLPIPISQAIKAGDVDRFYVTIAAPKSSYHNFNLDLYFNKGAKLHVADVRLDYYFPRWAVKEVKSWQPAK